MAKQTKTPYAILGLLTLRAMSGYELKSFYDRSLRFFWSESFGQIYPTLKWLEADGLVTGKDEVADRGKTRRRYAITEAGREYLRDWLEMGVEETPVRSELLLKVFFGTGVSLDTIRRHLRTQQVKAEERLAVYGAIAKAIQSENPDPYSSTMHLLTLDFGRRNLEMILAWCQASLETLTALEKTAGKPAQSWEVGP